MIKAVFIKIKNEKLNLIVMLLNYNLYSVEISILKGFLSFL